MTFNIRQFLATAVLRDLNRFRELLQANPEQADDLANQPDAILKSLTESLNYPHLQQKAVRLFIDSLVTFERWGHWVDCQEFAHTALKLDLPPEPKGYLHAGLGHIYYLSRNFDDSLHHLNCALTIAEEQQLNDLAGLVHHRMMNTHLGDNATAKAKEHGLQALAYLAGKPSINLAAVYNSLGLVAIRSGEFTMAENYFWDALSLWDNLKEYTQMARSYLNLGLLFFQQDNLESAKKCYQLSLEALGNSNSVVDELKALNGLGSVHYKLGEWGAAETIFRQGVARVQNNTDWYHLRGSLTHNLGNTLLAQGRPDQARFFLEKAITIWKQANDNLEKSNTVGTLAEVFEFNEQWETAANTYSHALTLLAEYPQHPWAISLRKKFIEARERCAGQM